MYSFLVGPKSGAAPVVPLRLKVEVEEGVQNNPGQARQTLPDHHPSSSEFATGAARSLRNGQDSLEKVGTEECRGLPNSC